ncbi:MAG: DUF2461 domain-containing protein [Oscillospiraceae bacterium]|nr:DUF2461 domain-containing protein [Oscillospiraceae bacterium]
MNFQGITCDALLLLSENRLQNSREFYEENKAVIQLQAIEPMRQLAAIAGAFLQEHDEKISVLPTRMVSRLRRDTRFSKDKTLYRDNLWLFVRRDKNAYPLHPGFWFEMFPNRSWQGVGYWHQPPAFLAFFRQWIYDNMDPFLAALHSANKAGYSLYGDDYKRPKPAPAPDYPDALTPFLMKKAVYFAKWNDDVSQLTQPDFGRKLCKSYSQLLPLYDCLKNAAEAYLREFPDGADKLIRER